MRLDSRTTDQIDSPISDAHDLLPLRAGARPLLDLSQAAPSYPPAPEVVEHISRVAADPEGAFYTEVPGLPYLRRAFASELTDSYDGSIAEENVVITAGCNQAFSLVTAALTSPGDEIVLTTPFYFNHDMWLRSAGVFPVYLEPAEDHVPHVADAERLITSRTRAVVLVTPGNPSGVTLEPAIIAEFAELAARWNIALILDETYRSFRPTAAPAHDQFSDPQWSETIVSLHSFSKDYAIPGYRVGAVVASPRLNREVCKLLDCVAVCAPRIGQEAALAGIRHARDWREKKRTELLMKQQWLTEAMAASPGGFELATNGAFFAWLKHPFGDARSTESVVRSLIAECDVLVVPGTAFSRGDRGMFRVSVNNLDRAGTVDLVHRFQEMSQ